mmetsp:Transcript_4091/g.5881  ORF Transcript_4091/g.5881 Transcript_4091/m.5881 type:complete len:319 (+) Transcript_4091:197-1153(+)|eukprot:CAMPEP_0184489492 /NCGR_PEP_ID=MMETSP0113_2-20130426/15615_1 /TAXON_ID=91329 /ORGANISM="Norrisiella sphaerica, Strain BC52" /LENGTH=318 /DNA_ID=CAMNT_0026872953 /DNA_START=130 /DNA_END=1086 /DNA_ORIENTATION=-
MDDWRKREAEILRRNAELEKKNEAALERFNSVVREQEANFQKNRYTEFDEEDEEGHDLDEDTSKPNQNEDPPVQHSPAQDQGPADKKSSEARYEKRDEDDTSALEMEGDLVPSGLSLQATVRLQKARLVALENALAKLSKENLDYSSRQQNRNKEVGDILEKNKQLKRSLQKAEQQAAKLKKAMVEAQNRAKGYERELLVAKKELDLAVKERDQLRSSSRNIDLKLNRALAEIDKLKGKVKNQRNQGRTTGEASKKEMIKINAENRRLQTHNKELIAAFKKQMKLIDVLKRQKMHMEAAKMLSFTEEEFAKTISFSRG